LLAAALSVGVFWGCSKENLMADGISTAIRPISVDNVKQWYKGGIPKNGQLGTRSSLTPTPFNVVPLFPLAFATQGTYSDSTFSGMINYVVTPIYNPRSSSSDSRTGGFMLFSRDEKGAIRSRLTVFMGDSTVYRSSADVINMKTFSGRVLMFDEENMLVSDELFKNGVLIEYFHGKTPYKTYFSGFTAPNGSVLKNRGEEDDEGGIGGWFYCLFHPNSQACGGCPSAGGSNRKKPKTSSDDNAAYDYSSQNISNFLGEYNNPINWVNTSGDDNAGNGNPSGGSSTYDPQGEYCNNLATGWEDEKLQAVLDGEMPASAYSGYLTSSSAADLAYRNKLRALQANGFSCEQLFQLKDNRDIATAIHDYYVGKGMSIPARNTVADLLHYLKDHPESNVTMTYHSGDFLNKYSVANFSISEFVKLASDPQLFAEIDEAANEGMDATFKEDALLYQKLMNESSEFAEVANTLNTLGVGGGGDPLKQVLLDLIVAGANEWLGNLLDLDALEELKSLLSDKTKDKFGKISFKVTKVIAKYVANKFPAFKIANSLWKIKEVYTKINRVYKRLSGLWQNRYFVGIEQKLEKIYESLKKNKLISKLDVDDNGGLLTNSNKDQSVWNDLVSVFGKTPISDGRNGFKFQVDDFIFNWYPVSDSYTKPTIEIIYKHPATGKESTVVKIRF
jgi:hypothetical protein